MKKFSDFHGDEKFQKRRLKRTEFFKIANSQKLVHSRGEGGCKMYKLVHSRGEGGKIGQNLVHVVVECPPK